MTDTPYHDLAAPIEAAEEPPMKDEPVAWLHTLHMEGGQTHERLLDWDGVDEYEPKRTAFGFPGRDYSEEYLVTTQPLYARPADDLVRQLVEAIPYEIVDDEGWSLSFCFGKGDAARDKMRAVADALRAQGYGG